MEAVAKVHRHFQAKNKTKNNSFFYLFYKIKIIKIEYIQNIFFNIK